MTDTKKDGVTREAYGRKGHGAVSWFSIHAGLILVLSVLFRVVALDHIPGINGDESFYGTNVIACLRGEPVQLKTPTGNLLNPLYSLPLLALQAVLPVSFWTLRLPAVLSGLLLIFLAFWLVRRLFDRETALLVALLTAALPVNIVYSRMGWDPSQSTCMAMIVIYCVWRERWGPACLALGAAWLVHPTNIFLVPLVLLWPAVSCLHKACRAGAGKALGVFVLGVLILLALVAFVAWRAPLAFQQMPERIWERIQAPQLFWAFLVDYGRLFSGVTVYQYVPGFQESAVSVFGDVFLAFSFTGIFVLGAVTFLKRKKFKEFGFLLGLAVTLVLFFLIAGNYAIRPHFERFSMFLVMPTILVVVLALRSLERGEADTRQVRYFVVLLSWLLLASFAVNFFLHFMRTGGTSHHTFITGVQEPKQAAFDIVREDSQGERADVYLSQWFNRGPVSYLGRACQNLDMHGVRSAARFSPSLRRKTYLVAFSGDKLDRRARRRYAHEITRSWAVRDFAGRVVLSVYRIR